MRSALEVASILPLKVDTLLEQRLRTAMAIIKADRLEVIEAVRQELFEEMKKNKLYGEEALLALDRARRRALGIE